MAEINQRFFIRVLKSVPADALSEFRRFRYRVCLKSCSQRSMVRYWLHNNLVMRSYQLLTGIKDHYVIYIRLNASLDVGGVFVEDAEALVLENELLEDLFVEGGSNEIRIQIPR